MPNLQDPADYMRRKLFGEKKPETKPAISDPEAKDEPDGDEGEALHIIVAKKPEGGYHSKMDAKDGFPPDESDHESLAEAHAAHAEALEKKFGEKAVEDAEEQEFPGIHDKVEAKLSGEKKGLMPKGGYLGKFGVEG
jgi:hypothetical protein